MTKIEWCDFKPHTRNPVLIKSGYVLVWCPEHPNANLGKKGHKGYIQEHRLVMSNYLQRPLESFENVHHINGNKADNRIENLELVSNSDHRKIHQTWLSPEEMKKKAVGLNRYAKAIKIPRTEVECACGCGMKFITPDSKGRYHKFIRGHNQRGQHWRWKNGDKNRICRFDA